MNEKFYFLPIEKQQRIINAGFRVFSQNTYKKSPMQEIADEAGISKSLLFHYFHNKKELYLFLWEKAADITIEYLTRNHCYECRDLFGMMERGMYAKIQIRDTGKGIASGHYNDIFKRFYRESSVSEEEGLGLGLYIARNIITLQRGYIMVHSAPGQGSCFSVFLPRQG